MPGMRLDLTDEETFALLNLLADAIEADRYPMSPRIRLLREILGKFGEIGPVSPELAQRLRRYAPPLSGEPSHPLSAASSIRRWSLDRGSSTTHQRSCGSNPRIRL